MQTFIIFASLVVSLGWLAFVADLLYALDWRLSRRFNRFITRHAPRRIFALLSTWMNFRYAPEPDGIESLPGQYLIVSNHQSLFDIPLFMRFLDPSRLRFVAKAELGKYIPLVSAMLKSDGHCLIRRTGGPSQSMRALENFAERVKAMNWIPVLFPEGTRSVDGSLGTFHPAGFRRFLDKAPMPVVVCAVDGGYRISKLSGLQEDLSGGRYRIKVLKTYPTPQNKAEQVQILQEARELIQTQLTTWRLTRE